MYAIVGVVVIIVIAVVALYLTGYLGGQAPTINVNIVDPAGSTPCPNLATACKFSPANFSATVNGQVTWKNTGSIPHTVTFNSTADGSLPAPSKTDSGSLDSGATFSTTFSAAGTYHYYCTIHSWMLGTITVA